MYGKKVRFVLAAGVLSLCICGISCSNSSQPAGGAWGSHVAEAGGGVTAPEAIQTVLSPWQPRADGPPTHRLAPSM